MPSVLIVDDSDDMRLMIRGVIARLAEPIYECRDGADAVAVCAQYRPDCVLMDIEMPITDGISATRQIVALLPSTRILIVTQYDDKRLRRAAREAGAHGYVLKENLLELRTVLRAL